MSLTVSNGLLTDGGGNTVHVTSTGALIPGLDTLGNVLGAPSRAIGGLLSGVTSTTTSALNGIQDVGSAAVTTGKSVVAAGAWLSDRNNWFRILKVILGGFMMIEGIIMLTSKPALTPQMMAALAKVVK